ncbi:hypothetical protein MTO96_050572 [Rhipicephalus appendiculatus]
MKKRHWERKVMLQQQQLQKQQEAEETAEGNRWGRSKESHGNKDFRARNDSFPRLEETTEGQQQRGGRAPAPGGGGGALEPYPGRGRAPEARRTRGQGSGARAGTKTM